MKETQTHNLMDLRDETNQIDCVWCHFIFTSIPFIESTQIDLFHLLEAFLRHNLCLKPLAPLLFKILQRNFNFNLEKFGFGIVLLRLNQNLVEGIPPLLHLLYMFH